MRRRRTAALVSLRESPPHKHHRCHICAGAALTPSHICAGTALTPATSAPGPSVFSFPCTALQPEEKIWRMNKARHDWAVPK